MKKQLLYSCLAVMFCFPGINTYAIPDYTQFEKFLLNDKLPSNSVNRIFHDSEGYMWFGTRDGLCRYDGYDIKVFRSSATTPGKLINNEIQFIAEDNMKRIWVGTFEGVNIIDKKSFSIRKLENPYINNQRINCILKDRDGWMWVATSNYGVVRINPETEEYIRYSSDSDSNLKINGNSVTQVYQDKAGRIWISSWSNGLCYLDLKKNIVVKAPPIGLKNNPFRMLEDSYGNIWICTWGDGLFNVHLNNLKDIEISPFIPGTGSNSSIDNIVYSIVEDKSKRIWLVTFTGLLYLDKNIDNSYKVTSSVPLFKSHETQLFHIIVSDRKGNIWLGSIGDGVYKMEYKKKTIINYPLYEIKKANTQSYVTRICQTPSGEIFIVFNRIGLYSFDRQTGNIARPHDQVLLNQRTISALIYNKSDGNIWLANEGDKYFHIFSLAGRELKYQSTISLPEIPQITENSINTFLEDKTGNVWIGAANAGLFLKRKGKNIELINNDLNNINDIKIDKNGLIWVGTEKQGLFRVEPDKRNPSRYTVSNFKLKIGDYECLSIQSILCKKEGDVYVATKEGGLFMIAHSDGKITELSGTYGISEEGFLEAIEDEFGNIWLSTLKRIIRYNPKSHASTYYSTSDGVEVSSFFKNSVIRLASGQILFGGNNGICEFDPVKLPQNTGKTNMKVMISDVLIQNKSLFDLTDETRYNKDKNQIILKSNENNLNIEFSALDLFSSGKIQYAYKMTGIDKDWNYVGNNRRFVNYSNLTPDEYIFMVKASDENGVWSNEITKLTIKVNPPFYRSWWAYLTYLILMVILSYIITRTIANRIRLRNELKISNIEKIKTEELTQVKLRYFTNISHELLTPLTIIMLQIESLQKKIQDSSVQFDIIKENVMRLKRLIRQILVFRKTESGNMKLKVIHNDIVAFVNNICQSNFNPQVVENQINFMVDIEYDSYLAWFDPDKLDKVIYNILSNAFKYTPKGGSIAVKMSFVPRKDEMIMRLSVSDTGSGIHENDLPHIFKRFYISGSSDQSQSHGIGLSLTHDLLEIHHGKIQVNSQLGEGTVFTIEIPVSANSYSADEMATTDENENELLDEIPVTETQSSVEISENEEIATTDARFTVLVVEDNKELNRLITDHFNEKYQVYSAENGLQALQIVKEHEIDLIISDVMMPEMDGLTFCKIIKNELTTSHIAVLMLTAKNSAEDRIDCYNAGADAFISKPFELAVLSARVKNLIHKRNQKAELFRHEQDITISSMEYNSLDEIFLKQCVRKVEENLSDESFDFDKFAIELATSKSTLHRKLKSLTGLSPGEFIKNVRMKHAVQMLNNNIGNISEIAYALGFNDPKYFSRCFKAEFDMTPKEWMDKNKNKIQK